jgi:hypothetical protein
MRFFSSRQEDGDKKVPSLFGGASAARDKKVSLFEGEQAQKTSSFAEHLSKADQLDSPLDVNEQIDFSFTNVQSPQGMFAQKETPQTESLQKKKVAEVESQA